MKAVIQRVREASVTVDGRVTGQIGSGLAVLLGVVQGDTQAQADILAKKIVEMRIFTDEQDKMNRSLLDIKGQALVVSQFTLAADWLPWPEAVLYASGAAGAGQDVV